MNKAELKNIVSGFDAGNSFAQSLGGTASNYSATMFGVSVYGAPKEDIQAAATAPKLQRFDLN